MATRYRVLLVDPVKTRRDQAAAATRLRFDIVGAGTAAEANAVVVGTVHAIVLTLRQLDDNGLVLARTLRTRFGSEPYILVHGSTVPPHAAEDRALIAGRHGVDLWVAKTLDADGLEPALWAELERRFRPRERVRKVDDVDDEETWRSVLTGPATVDNMKKLLTKDIFGRKKS